MSQFNDPTMGSPPPKKSSALKWVLIILGVLVVLPIVCCGIPGWMIYQRGKTAFNEVMKQAMIDQTAGSPEIQEHIGEIKTATMDFSDSMKRTQEAEKAGERGSWVTFSVEGTKGKGKVIVKNSPAGGGAEKITLELPDGRSFEVQKNGAVPPSP